MDNTEISIPEMLSRLDKLYQREDEIKKQFQLLIKEAQQIKEDIEMMQMMIMYKSNREKNSRI
jgi:hypothetical protein